MEYGTDFCTGGTATSSGGYQTPDKGFDNFKRYVGLAICAYNLRRIGAGLLSQMINTQENHKLAA